MQIHHPPASIRFFSTCSGGGSDDGTDTHFPKCLFTHEVIWYVGSQALAINSYPESFCSAAASFLARGEERMPGNKHNRDFSKLRVFFETARQRLPPLASGMMMSQKTSYPVFEEPPLVGPRPSDNPCWRPPRDDPSSNTPGYGARPNARESRGAFPELGESAGLQHDWMSGRTRRKIRGRCRD